MRIEWSSDSDSDAPARQRGRLEDDQMSGAPSTTRGESSDTDSDTQVPRRGQRDGVTSLEELMDFAMLDLGVFERTAPVLHGEFRVVLPIEQQLRTLLRIYERLETGAYEMDRADVVRQAGRIHWLLRAIGETIPFFRGRGRLVTQFVTALLMGRRL